MLISSSSCGLISVGLQQLSVCARAGRVWLDHRTHFTGIHMTLMETGTRSGAGSGPGGGGELGWTVAPPGEYESWGLIWARLVKVATSVCICVNWG